jgi:8-oxo-dGTP diphosphatase
VSEPPDVLAAGAVVGRKHDGRREVLLVHRPKYDDWSFPKGKLDLGEHVTAAAVREVAEETGLDVRLGPPLSPQAYPVRNGDGVLRTKRVSYWAGFVVGDDDVSGYAPNAEIDEVAWVPLERAERLLTHDVDRATLAQWRPLGRRSTPLVVLRHARTLSRSAYDGGDDRDRPLSEAGEHQAELLVPVLGAYAVSRVVTSSSRRCWASVAPYAEATGHELEDTDDLSEEDATPERVTKVVEDLLAGQEPAVLCTHRPVLPMVLAALGLEDRKLAKGGLLVVHHRKGGVVAVEEHEISFQ